MGKHHPKPKTYVYYKNGSRYTLVFNSAGEGWIPNQSYNTLQWVDSKAKIKDIRPMSKREKIKAESEIVVRYVESFDKVLFNQKVD